jgi:hypothetical protein
LRYCEALRNARLDAIAAAVSGGAKMRLFSGALPNTCESVDPPLDTLMAELELPPQPFLPAAGGRLVSSHEPWRGLGLGRAKNGTVVECFRLYDAHNRCHIQGSVGVEGWHDLVLSTTKIAAGQSIVIDFKIVERE